MNSRHLCAGPARQDRPRPVPLRVRLALLLGAVAALATATPTAFYAPLWQAGLWALCAFTVALFVGIVAARCVSEALLALARDVSARHTVGSGAPGERGPVSQRGRERQRDRLPG